MALSAKDMQIMAQRQTGIARKVYEVVPIEQVWTSRQVVGELVRLGSRPDKQIVEGCLNSLRQSGLIDEVKPGYFRRAKARGEALEQAARVLDWMPATQREEVLSVTDNSNAQKTEPNQFEGLAGIAEEIRRLSKQFAEIADKIDVAALTALQEAGDVNAELVKLRQFRSLLKELA